MEEGTVVNRGSDELMKLPPGFRFHPTDEEIITCYLTEKVMNRSFIAIAIGEADLNKSEPWDLPEKAKMGEKEWYFFCQRDRKYPTGMRTNRATESGYWKATGKDKEIFNNKGKNGCLVGMKKTLVFYRGRAPKGEKTNWVMHEYRLEGKISQYNNLSKAAKDEWVVCRVFHKNMGLKKGTTPIRISPFGDHHDLLDCSSLPPLMDPTNIKPACDYGDYDFKPAGTNYNSAAAARPLSAAQITSSSTSDHGSINTNNYLNYCSNGGLKPNHHNFQVPLQPTSYYNSYPTTAPNMAAMLYPQQQQQQQHHHQFHQNPSHQPNPNNSDYCFQQGMMHMRDASSSIFPNSSNQAAAGSRFQTRRNQANAAHHGDDDDDQAILRAIAAASNTDNNNMNRSNHDTSSSAGGLGLERQCKVEQFSSNQSMFSISQDTGISTDLNTTDISSSLVSKQELGSTNNSSYHHDDDQDPSVVPISDIDGLWDF